MRNILNTVIIILSLVSINCYAVDERTTFGSPQTESFEESWFTANKFHQYMGLGSIALAAVTIVIPKPEEGEDVNSSPHHLMAKSAAALGIGAVATGLTFHYKDLSFHRMFSNPDNWHALLAGLGAAGFVLAVAEAPDEGHAAVGAAGFTLMASAIKITW